MRAFTIGVGAVTLISCAFITGWLIDAQKPRQVAAPQAPCAPEVPVTEVSGGQISVDRPVRGEFEPGVQAKPAPAAPAVLAPSADKEEVAALKLKIAELERRIALLERELGVDQTVKSEPAPPPAPVETPRDLTVRFGKYSGLSELRGANWKTIAAGNKDMTSYWRAVVDNYLHGGSYKDASPHISALARLRAVGEAATGKIATNIPARLGTMTHPAILANYLSAVLEAAGLPLATAQISRLEALGNDYEQQFDSLNSTYSGSTTRVQKMLDEAELRGVFLAAALDALSKEQRAVVEDPACKDYLCCDLYGPTMALHCACGVLQCGSRDAVLSTLMARMAGDWGIDETRFENVRYIFEAWVRELGDAVEPRQKGRWALPTTQEVYAAGRASQRAQEQLMVVLDISEAERERIRECALFWIPRVEN